MIEKTEEKSMTGKTEETNMTETDQGQVTEEDKDQYQEKIEEEDQCLQETGEEGVNNYLCCVSCRNRIS